MPLARETQPIAAFSERSDGTSTDAQKSAEAFARRAEQEAKRDAIVKARPQAEADSIDAKTMRLRALRMAKEEREPGLIAFEGLAATGLDRVSARLTISQ